MSTSPRPTYSRTRTEAARNRHRYPWGVSTRRRLPAPRQMLPSYKVLALLVAVVWSCVFALTSIWSL